MLSKHMVLTAELHSSVRFPALSQPSWPGYSQDAQVYYRERHSKGFLVYPPLPRCLPAEVDNDADIASGAVPGAKRAAVRKLHHELGIPTEQLPLHSFKYLTRLHYCAADTGA